MFLLTVALLGCRSGGRPTTVSPPRSDAAALTSQVTAQLTRAAGDWNRGNLDGRRTRHGIDFIRQYYTPRFAAGARRDSLRFEEVEARPLSPSLALVTARFILERGGTTTASGPFTLVIEQRPEGWRILHDHSSSDPH